MRAIQQVAAERGGGYDVLDLLRVIGEVRASLPDMMSVVGMEARAQGRTWREIADALGYGTPARAQQVVDPGVREAKRLSDAWPRSEPAPRDLPGWSVAEAAAMVGVSRSTMYARVREGRYETREVGGRLRIIAGPGLNG